MLSAFEKRIAIVVFLSLIVLTIPSRLAGQFIAATVLAEVLAEVPETLKSGFEPVAVVAEPSPQPFVAKKLRSDPTISIQTEVRIDSSERTGKIITHFGFDLKGWQDNTKTAAKASALYRDTNANLVRIPIFASAHRENGSVDASVYGPLLTSIQNIKSVNPKVKVFASLKLLKERTFPAWIASKENGKIFSVIVKRPDPKKYARLVADYIGLLAKQNIAIDFLGLNNECSNALTADRYVATAKELTRLLKQRKIPERFRSFQYIGSEGFGVTTSVRYAQAIKKANGLDFAHIFGSHFYPDLASGSIDDWTRLAKVADRPIWHTEVHVRNSDSPADNIAKIRDGLAIVFKTNQKGVQGYVWWARAHENSSLTNLVRRSVVNTLLGGSCVKTSGSYQAKDNAKDATLFQATLVDNTIWLWCCNPGAAMSDVTVVLESRAAKSSQGRFWAGGDSVTASTSGTLNVKSIIKARGRKLTIKSLPATSIGLVKIDLARKPKEKTKKKTKKKPEKKPVASPLVSEREWHSTTGSKTILATLLSVNNGVGRFRRSSGESFEFSIEKLIPADRDLVAKALGKK